MQVSKNETENEMQIAEFRKKYNRRLFIITFISGLLFITTSFWGIFYYQGETDLSAFLMVNLILGCCFCALALMSPSIDKWRSSRLNHVLLPPAGWDTFALSILWVLLLFWEGMLEARNLPSNWTSDPQGFIYVISYFGMMCFFCLGAFLIELPQAMKSVYLSFRVYIRESGKIKKPSIPMDCWREENFSGIIKRLCHRRRFKRQVPESLISRIKLVYRNKILMPESTPTQEGLRFYARVAVILE